MKTLSDIQQILTQIKPQIQEQYHVTELGIFGSYVRGEQTPDSDVDILVSFDPDYRFGLLTYCELEEHLSQTLGTPVDLVMKDGLKPRIGQHILKEVIYL